ncbi:UNKNOWN [Stylonychia lemnae]|uniref:Rhodanese domain-containing protein n=1 Tax=Stylonychia lemnae TaxID=5949 RepID=A0A078AQQ3_STYLE|nr:UNKNOWN [Stylonychia lemnae]|eukprot:CDW84256.1 UNKNOWN [Stylonychia lemnae]
MLKEEKMKASEKLSLKVSSITNAFNMLQDMRHILILDMRPREEFEELHIRKSLHSTLENYHLIIQSIFSTKNPDYNSQYEGDDMKRIMFIFPNSDWKAYDSAIGQQIVELGELILKAYQERLSKVYFLKDFKEFQKKYSFLCVNDSSDQIKQIRSLCRYPSEIKDSLIYIGNMMNTMDAGNLQISSLGFKTIIYLTPKRFEHIDNLQGVTTHYFELQEPSKPQVPFDEIIKTVLEELQSKVNLPILIFDVSGIISAAIGVKIMLETNKAWSKEIAMAYILNKRYEAKDMPSWLYSQILLAGQKKFKSEPLMMAPEGPQ